MQYRLPGPGLKQWIFTVLKAAAGILLAAAVVYIMVNGLGLAEELDFGAGAYYYADIPNFSEYVSGEHFTSDTPMWVLVVLFRAWGFLMYRLWVFLDRKTGGKQD